MKFRYFVEEDLKGIEDLIVESYKYGNPIWGFSRNQFSYGLHVAWGDILSNWKRTVGIWEENGKIISAVIDEGVWSGEVFFLFDGLERQDNTELLESMFKHAQTHFSKLVDKKTHSRAMTLCIPSFQTGLKKAAENRGYTRSSYDERALVLPFKEKPFETTVPKGYSIVEGTNTPSFFLANTHVHSFEYDGPIVERILEGFDNLRKMPGYKPELDFCMLDPEGKPVAMAIVWYDERLPYCELEPLGVVWWERRKGIAKAIVYEACNSVMKLYPTCGGMLGGDQDFYTDIGFEVQGVSERWEWKNG